MRSLFLSRISVFVKFGRKSAHLICIESRFIQSGYNHSVVLRHLVLIKLNILPVVSCNLLPNDSLWSLVIGQVRMLVAQSSFTRTAPRCGVSQYSRGNHGMFVSQKKRYFTISQLKRRGGFLSVLFFCFMRECQNMLFFLGFRFSCQWAVLTSQSNRKPHRWCSEKVGCAAFEYYLL